MSDGNRFADGRERPNRLVPEEPTEFPPGVCGSRHWSQLAMQFNVEKMACVALPRQAVAVGTQIMFVSPIIENPLDRCSMWTPEHDQLDDVGTRQRQ